MIMLHFIDKSKVDYHKKKKNLFYYTYVNQDLYQWFFNFIANIWWWLPWYKRICLIESYTIYNDICK